jgi:hypothetical protein
VDEVIARIAERTDFSNVDKGFWSKITDLFNGMLEKLGFKTKITEDDLKQILKASYANLMKTAEERTGRNEGEAEAGRVGEGESGKGEPINESEIRYSESEAPEFHHLIDDLYDNPDFDKEKYNHKYFNIGATPDWMKSIGVSGDFFSLPFKSIKKHKSKDEDHDLTKSDWHQIPGKIQMPFLLTQYKSNPNRFRLYLNLVHNGKYVVAGVDLVRFNQGRYKPILEINKIKTIFWKKSERFSDDEIVLAYDENITPEQKSFLQGHNFLKYPTIQELSVNKVSENISSDQTNSENNAGKTSYSRPDRDDRFVNDPGFKLLQKISG